MNTSEDTDKPEGKFVGNDDEANAILKAKDATTGVDQAETESKSFKPEDWQLALGILRELLTSNNGCVSSTMLRRALERQGLADSRRMMVELTFFDPETSVERGIPTPDFTFFHLGRSFYSEDKYRKALEEAEAATSKEAEDASKREMEVTPEEAPSASRSNRQREARLVTYVKSALEELYSSEANAEDNTYVFDVHGERKGGSFENVDLIAIHWRPCEVVELITVEAKLEFNAEVVQQASNYARFSHRAWIAIPVEADSSEAAIELREKNPNLFEYAISLGLGILACRRRQGQSYHVFPVHWPLRNEPGPLEREEFLERYRKTFEEAGILEKRVRRPSLRWH